MVKVLKKLGAGEGQLEGESVDFLLFTIEMSLVVRIEIARISANCYPAVFTLPQYVFLDNVKFGGILLYREMTGP